VCARLIMASTILPSSDLSNILLMNDQSILIELEVAKMIEAGIAGAEIIDRDLDADIAEPLQDSFGVIEAMHHRSLGNLDFKAPRRKAPISRMPSILCGSCKSANCRGDRLIEMKMWSGHDLASLTARPRRA
jgi:hypothetical protein